jgi:hypothetical protein
MRRRGRSRAERRPAPRLRWAAALGAVAATLASTSVALAAFTSSATGGPMALATKRIFPGLRSAWPWEIQDASAGGAEVNSSDPLSYADGIVTTTKTWSNSFAANRFDDFDLSSGRPAGIPVSSATFNFTFAASRVTDNACFYLEVRRASTNALLGTHGSAGSPSACANLGAQVAASVDISAEVTGTDIANDLRIRVYANESASKAIKIDLATVAITTPYVTSTLAERRFDDEANTASAVSLWPLTAADGTAYTSSGSLAAGFSTTRYVKFTPSAAVPASASISTAEVLFAYKSATAGDTTCWYFEVYNGASLIGTHGSSTAPVSCNGTTSFLTDTVPVPELRTVAAANNAVLKVYMKNSGARKALVDLVQLDLNYYLD